MTGTYFLSEYQLNKYEWIDTTGDGIDWNRISNINMGIGKRIFISSFSHQWLPLNKRLFERNAMGSPMCTIYDNHEENDCHFIGCKEYPKSNTPSILKRINEILDKNNVDPWLDIILLRGLRESVAGEKQIEQISLLAMYLPLFQKQQELGWNQL